MSNFAIDSENPATATLLLSHMAMLQVVRLIAKTSTKWKYDKALFCNRKNYSALKRKAAKRSSVESAVVAENSEKDG